MSRILIKQPNGLYMLFSTTVDCPIEWNLTDTDYISMCLEEAKNAANTKLRSALANIEDAKDLFVANNMTQQEFDDIVQQVSKPVICTREYDEYFAENVLCTTVCEICAGRLQYCDEYDSFYCKDCDVWRRPRCPLPDCPYCSTRPEKPSEVIDG